MRHRIIQVGIAVTAVLVAGCSDKMPLISEIFEQLTPLSRPSEPGHPNDSTSAFFPAGCVAQYSLNQSTLDESGSSNHGANRGVQPFAEDSVQGYRFGPDSGYIQVDHSQSLALEQEITIACRFRFFEGGTKNPRIVHKGDAFEIFTWGSGAIRKLCFGVNFTALHSTSYFTPEHLFNAGEWIELACVAKGTQRKIYLNGNLLATTTSTVPLQANDSEMLIGQNSVSYRDLLHGDIDYLYIFDRALCEKDIRLLASSN